MTQCATLSVGYSPVPPGHLAAVVTHLEMRARPEGRPVRPLPPGMELVRLIQPDVEAYRALYRTIGEDWLWFSRLIMSDDDLVEILNDPNVEIYVLRNRAAKVGLLELDFRVDKQCELAFLGLEAGAIGMGLGSVLMTKAIEMAWSRPIERFWVHTCTYDHPAALPFYQRSGFVPFLLEVEVAPDPRISGIIPRERAAHVPIIG